MALSIEEYLASGFEPECEFVDGVLEERLGGEWDHARLQLKIGAYFLARCESMGMRVAPELRIRVTETRVRVPDLCVFAEDPGQQVPSIPPVLCIEILSPEDRMSRVEIRINDYLGMGVRAVWIIDPQTRQAFTATAAEGLREVKSGVLTVAEPAIEMPLSAVC